MRTHYQVLGILRTADGAQIKRQYYALCKQYHPDVTGGDHEKMVAINEAYQILSNPTDRSRYDRELTARERAEAEQTTRARTTTTYESYNTTPQSSYQYARKPAQPSYDQAFHAARATKPRKGKGRWFAAICTMGIGLIAAAFLLPAKPDGAIAQTPSTTPAAQSSASADASSTASSSDPTTNATAQTDQTTTDNGATTTTNDPTTDTTTTFPPASSSTGTSTDTNSQSDTTTQTIHKRHPKWPIINTSPTNN